MDTYVRYDPDTHHVLDIHPPSADDPPDPAANVAPFDFDQGNIQSDGDDWWPVTYPGVLRVFGDAPNRQLWRRGTLAAIETGGRLLASSGVSRDPW